MRVTLDACVIYPSVLRAILLRLARAGLFEPVWSERILEEWARACVKLGPGAPEAARAEAAAMRAVFPRALQPARPEIEARHILPDPADLHVLATAIASGSDAILTFNAADFRDTFWPPKGWSAAIQMVSCGRCSHARPRPWPMPSKACVRMPRRWPAHLSPAARCSDACG